MPQMPAFCDLCGNVFPSGFNIQSGATIKRLSITNFQGQCPRCRGPAHVPDGVYTFVDDTLKILSAPERSIQELKKLAQILTAARAKPQPAGDLEEKIKAHVPAFAPLANWIPKTAADRIAYIGVLLSAISLVVAMRDKPSAPVTVQQVIENTYIQAPAEPAKAPAQKVGRNAPCPCGSGKKYKRCCGNLGKVRPLDDDSP